VVIRVKDFPEAGYVLVLCGLPDNTYKIWELCGPDYDVLADGRDHGLSYDSLEEAVKVFEAWEDE